MTARTKTLAPGHRVSVRAGTASSYTQDTTITLATGDSLTINGTVVEPPPPTLTISAIAATSTTTGATIAWHVSEGAQGWVEYGSSTTYGAETTHETSFTYTDHSQTITGLASGATYHYRIHAVNPAGAQATSPDGTFTTAGAPPPPPPPTGTYPPITTLRSVSRPPVPALEPIAPASHIDPTWGTKITRVGEAGEHNAYSSRPAWNCDGSLLLLDYPPNALRVMLDGHDYHLLKRTPPTRQFWSNVDPNLLWGPEGTSNVFSAVDWRDGTTPKRYTCPAAVTLGDYEGNMPNDDSITVLQTPNSIILIDCTAPSGPAKVIKSMTFGAHPNNARMSQSGKYVVVQFGQYVNGQPVGFGTGPEDGTWVLDLNLNRLRQISTWSDHMDVGVANGRDVVVFVSRNSNAAAQFVYMDTGTVVALTPTLGNWPGGSGHVSCRNIKQPGWAYFSDAAYDQVVAINLENPSQVRVYGFGWNPGSVPYDMSQFACPSPDGTRVTYGSIRSGQVYGYVAEAA